MATSMRHPSYISSCFLLFTICKCKSQDKTSGASLEICAALFSVFSMIGDAMTAVEGGTLAAFAQDIAGYLLVLAMLLGRACLLVALLRIIFHYFTTPGNARRRAASCGFFSIRKIGSIYMLWCASGLLRNPLTILQPCCWRRELLND